MVLGKNHAVQQHLIFFQARNATIFGIQHGFGFLRAKLHI
jgi:hypothetical protein